VARAGVPSRESGARLFRKPCLEHGAHLLGQKARLEDLRPSFRSAGSLTSLPRVCKVQTSRDLEAADTMDMYSESRWNLHNIKRGLLKHFCVSNPTISGIPRSREVQRRKRRTADYRTTLPRPMTFSFEHRDTNSALEFHELPWLIKALIGSTSHLAIPSIVFRQDISPPSHGFKIRDDPYRDHRAGEGSRCCSF
jgi:hypothetical protein